MARSLEETHEETMIFFVFVFVFRGFVVYAETSARRVSASPANRKIVQSSIGSAPSFL
jgi:hypothetical protein